MRREWIAYVWRLAIRMYRNPSKRLHALLRFPLLNLFILIFLSFLHGFLLRHQMNIVFQSYALKRTVKESYSCHMLRCHNINLKGFFLSLFSRIFSISNPRRNQRMLTITISSYWIIFPAINCDRSISVLLQTLKQKNWYQSSSLGQFFHVSHALVD